MTIVRNQHVGRKTITGIGKEFIRETEVKKKKYQFVWWGWELWWTGEECPECGQKMDKKLSNPFGFRRETGCFQGIYDWYLWLGFFEIRKWHNS